MKTSNFMTFVGGAIAGAAIALLFAPQKGEDTRRMIREEIDKMRAKCGCGCGCGPDCECGCQDGQVCTCEDKSKE